MRILERNEFVYYKHNVRRTSPKVNVKPRLPKDDLNVFAYVHAKFALYKFE